MDPVNHFLVAFLPLTGYSLVRYRRVPRGSTLLVLLFATQLPDLVDKPLSWTFGLTPSGRMVAHSLVVSTPVITGVVYTAHQSGYGSPGNVFAFGYLSHLAADFYPILYLGSSYYFFPNLFWPLLSANPDRNTSFGSHVLPLETALVYGIGFTLLLTYCIVDIHRNRTDRDPLIGFS